MRSRLQEFVLVFPRSIALRDWEPDHDRNANHVCRNGHRGYSLAQLALGQSGWSPIEHLTSADIMSSRTAGTLSRRQDQNWRI